MAGPAIPILIALAVAALAVALGLAVWVNRHKLKKWWKGEKIAVLGERGIGKTSLITFLSEGSLPEFLTQTLKPVEFMGRKFKLEDLEFLGRKFKLEDLELKLQECLDVSGTDYCSWKKVFNDANTVIYLFRADKVIQNDKTTSENIKSHIKKMEEWLSNNGNKKIVLVGTYLDQLDDYHKYYDKSSCGDYYDNFKRIDLISNSISSLGGEKKTNFVLGTMKDETGTKILVHEIFKTKFD